MKKNPLLYNVDKKIHNSQEAFFWLFCFYTKWWTRATADSRVLNMEAKKIRKYDKVSRKYSQEWDILAV